MKVGILSRVIPNEEAIPIFYDTDFRAADGSSGSITGAGAKQGLKIFSFEETEMRAVLYALSKYSDNGPSKVVILMDTREVMRALNGV